MRWRQRRDFPAVDYEGGSLQSLLTAHGVDAVAATAGFPASGRKRDSHDALWCGLPITPHGPISAHGLSITADSILGLQA
jgi:hypothetical protein